MEGQEVDWKRLVQLALLGSNDLANKLFVAGSTQTMYETLVKAKVPFPRLMTYFVAGVEFVGGSLVTVGFLSSLASVALLVDRLVAILTTNLSAMPKGLSPLNWLDDFLYLPEVLYVLFFIWLVCSGPGKFSADYWLAGTLLR
jgi:putative oxidoreductase